MEFNKRLRKHNNMAIITIARECCSHGAEIAEKVAVMLGYECITRRIPDVKEVVCDIDPPYYA